MTSDDEEAQSRKVPAVNFDTMSIEELEDYIVELTAKIEQTKQVIEKKRNAHSAADSFFKN
ncbi:MAG: DUF1192 domain-containing protein [Proteobacteria bacterium]|nr:DUF1192 domain-containing protein [Pseudomonadota bacterium]